MKHKKQIQEKNKKDKKLSDKALDKVSGGAGSGGVRKPPVSLGTK